jgi:hypothetical protein
MGRGPSYNYAYILDKYEFFDSNKQTMRVFLANNALPCVRVTPETCFVVDKGIVQKIGIVKSGMIAA